MGSVVDPKAGKVRETTPGAKAGEFRTDKTHLIIPMPGPIGKFFQLACSMAMAPYFCSSVPIVQGTYHKWDTPSTIMKPQTFRKSPMGREPPNFCYSQE